MCFVRFTSGIKRNCIYMWFMLCYITEWEKRPLLRAALELEDVSAAACRQSDRVSPSRELLPPFFLETRESRAIGTCRRSGRKRVWGRRTWFGERLRSAGSCSDGIGCDTSNWPQRWKHFPKSWFMVRIHGLESLCDTNLCSRLNWCHSHFRKNTDVLCVQLDLYLVCLLHFW